MDEAMKKTWFTFLIVALTPVFLFVVFEKIQFPLIKGIGGF
jgi:hypothetical protein